MKNVENKSFIINEQNVASYATKMAAWIRKTVHETSSRGIILGMSSGIDCSVVSRLCQLAEVETLLVLMPYGDDMKNTESLNHAMELIEKFNFSYHIFDIKPAVDALTLPTNSPLFEVNKAKVEISRANLRPRVRMTYLYHLAQLDNRFVAGTGNMAERIVGYFTKWGDGGCDFNPLALLTKKEVYTLAVYLKIPNCIIQKKPSAGLWEGQTDEEDLGMTYAQIDAFILNGTSGNQEIDSKIHQCIAISRHKFDKIPIFEG